MLDQYVILELAREVQGVACVGGGGGGVSAVSGLGGCTAELVPSPQSAPGLPPPATSL